MSNYVYDKQLVNKIYENDKSMSNYIRLNFIGEIPPFDSVNAINFPTWFNLKSLILYFCFDDLLGKYLQYMICSKHVYDIDYSNSFSDEKTANVFTSSVFDDMPRHCCSL